MLGLKIELSRLWHWQSDSLNTWLDLIHKLGLIRGFNLSRIKDKDSRDFRVWSKITKVVQIFMFFIEDQAFSPSYDLALTPSPPLPSPPTFFSCSSIDHREKILSAILIQYCIMAFFVLQETVTAMIQPMPKGPSCAAGRILLVPSDQ